MARRLWLWIPAVIAVVGVSGTVGALVANRDDDSDSKRVSPKVAATTSTTTTAPTTVPPTTAPPTTATAPPSTLPPTTAAATPTLIDCQTLVADYFAKYKAVYGFTAAPSGQELVEHFTFAGRADCIDPFWRLPSLREIVNSPPNTAGCAAQRGVGSCPP